MTSQKQTGGAAFPHNKFDRHHHTGEPILCGSDEGMSLRDWFAGMAMQGIFKTAEAMTEGGFKSGEDIAKGVAGLAYMIADAMIVERAK